MECDVCHKPIEPGTATYDDALQMPVCLDCVRFPREVERRHLLSTLKRAHGNRTEAARLLGISARCLQDKLKAHAIGVMPQLFGVDGTVQDVAPADGRLAFTTNELYKLVGGPLPPHPHRS